MKARKITKQLKSRVKSAKAKRVAKKTVLKTKKKIEAKIVASVAKVTKPPEGQSFPVVGIGASAGGLEALTQLFSALPADTGMGFVVIQHLDPKLETHVPDILSRATKMPVVEIQEGMRVHPDHVYVLPINHSVAISHGVLSLLPRALTDGSQIVIDSFFHSLANDQRGRAVGVILSGAASDGTEGLKAIKAEGGIAIAQDPKSAKFDSMPRSAIGSGIVDLILSPKEIAHELARISHHPYILAACEENTLSGDAKKQTREENFEGEEVDPQSEVALRKIFSLLKTHVQVDFSNYKHTTLKRRLERRMMVRKSGSIDAYVQFLRSHPDEVKALYADFLIHVTEFFRDPESYKALKDHVFPNLIKNRSDTAPIRVWVPGCATGEEAYSLAIKLVEFLNEKGAKISIQIFATDISEQALKKARAGFYSEAIERVISKDRLRLFFDKVDGGYKISKNIREMCLFSRHDVTRDPPFAKLDLVSCRNVLIYFAPVLQKRVLPTFHYALKPGGFLWLGRSEGPGEFSKLFSLEDKTHKIYSKINNPTPMTFQFPTNAYVQETEEITQLPFGRMKADPNFQREIDQIAFSKFVPPGVVVNADMEILQFRGRTVPYLEPASGPTSNHLFKMARQELLPGLRIAVQAAIKQNKPSIKEGLSFELDGKRREVNVEVIPANPLSPSDQRNYVIFFQEVSTKHLPKLKKGKSKRFLDDHSQRNKHLEQELSASRQFQQSMTAEFEVTKEELTSSNEELQSTNEELQSSNEEMETTKEELQSLNEELSTVNDELQNRNSELTVLGSDLNNLFISAEIPIIVIIGGDRRIRRFTPKAEKFFNLIPGDVGRPIRDINSNFDLNLDALVSEVVSTLIPKEKEILGHSGRWLRVSVRPYKTMDNRIDGAVIVLVDIHDLKQRLDISDAALKQSMSIVDTVQLPFVVLDHDLHLISANASFFRYFQISPHEIGASFFDILGVQSERFAGLRGALNESLTSSIESKKFEVDYESRSLGSRKLQICAKKIQWIGSESEAILVALEDITERKQIEKELGLLLIREREARAEAENGNRAKDLFLATLSHELRTPLTAILTWSQMLRMGKMDSEKSKRAVAIIEKSAKLQQQLISDLLDVSRAIMGKLHLELEEVNPVQAMEEALDAIRPIAEEKSIKLKTTIESVAGVVSADRVRLQQIFLNLLTNAIKFSEKGGVVEIRLDVIKIESNRSVRIRVIDAGKGIPVDFLPSIFDRFSQADNTSTRGHGGLGLGLAIVRNLVELHSGTVQADSEGLGKGATFTITLPLALSCQETEDSLALHKGPLQQTENSEDHPKLNGIRVLIVDDEDDARDAFTELLSSFGAETKAVSSAHEALLVFSAFRPHVLMSDIAMPGEDGYSLMKKIRALGPKAGGEVPSLALTAYASGEDVQRAYSVGFQAHLAKPVESIDLGKVIFSLAGLNIKNEP